MLIFLFVALSIYGAMHFYAFHKVWKAFPQSKALLVSLVAAGIVLCVSPVFVRYLENQDWHAAATVTAWVAYTWMGYLLLFFFVGVAFDLCRGIAALLKIRRIPSGVIVFRIVAIVSLAMLGYGFVEARDIQVERVTITTPKLASGRITIAQISDLHLGVTIKDRFLDRVMAKVAELRPDIVVGTGDIVDGQGDELNSLAARFHVYRAPLGTYAVTGNHEYIVGLDHSLRFLRNAGFTLLRAESARTGGIVLAGVDDSSRMSPGQDARTDVRQALAAATDRDFIVLLKHKPVVDDGLPFDLQLSGHTHGGQIFPLALPTRLINGVPTGMTRLDLGRQLYVSRGVGTWGPPIRLFSPPEITLFTIESSNK